MSRVKNYAYDFRIIGLYLFYFSIIILYKLM